MLLAPGRHDAVHARVGNRLTEVLVLIEEQHERGTLLGRILTEHPRRRIRSLSDNPATACRSVA